MRYEYWYTNPHICIWTNLHMQMHVAYRGIFVAGTYIAITLYIHAAFSCVFKICVHQWWVCMWNTVAVQRKIHVYCGRYTCLEACGINGIYVYQCLRSHCWLQWVYKRHIYWHTCLIAAHKLICLCRIYMAFEGRVWCWYIYGNNMVNKSCSFFLAQLVH